MTNVPTSLSLNGFKITWSAERFTVHVQPFPDPKTLKDYRIKHSSEWFLHWREGMLYGLPRVDSPTIQCGDPVIQECKLHSSLHVLAARINDLLPAKFPQYAALRNRPFAFLGRKDELVSKITAGWSIPPLIQHFTIKPKFELDPRLIELSEGSIEVGLFMQVETRWEIHASLMELERAGIDLAGLHVIRRNPQIGERRSVGKISHMKNGRAYLSESYDNREYVPAGDVALEGSRTSFSRCLRVLLGRRFQDFEEGRYLQEAALSTGPALNELLRKMEDVLRKASPLAITKDLECSFTSRIPLLNSDTYTSVVACKPVEYCFDVAKSKRHEFAWRGLERFGPYHGPSKRTPRILVICPDTTLGKVSQFIKLFRDGVVSVQNCRYAKGFAGTFGLVNPEFIVCGVPFRQLGEQSAATFYRSAVEEHLASTTVQYDAAIIVILDEHARLPDAVSPYLHTKACLLMAGIPVQEVRLSTISAAPASLQYTMQNLSVALFAKMGGVPWTVDHNLTVDDEIVIGMGTAELSGNRYVERQRHVGITTVFRGDGNYLLSHLSKECPYEEYPEVLKSSTLSVLREIKERNGWRQGDTVRLVFHIFKPLRNIEVADIIRTCVEEVGDKQNVQFAFLTISHDHPFKLLDLAQEGINRHGECKGRFAPGRGVMAQLGRNTRLLNTNGPMQLKKPTSPLPRPLLIHLHPQSTYPDLTYLSEQALKFTSLTWRSTLPAESPVTIYYSELIAELLARLRHVPDWSPSMLNVKLRFSRWFL